MQKRTYNLILTALFMAIGIILPKVFHMFAMGGPIFLPMHIPVLLCGLICGWQYGALLGIVLPIFSSVTTGMPPLFPMGLIMTFELCAYGFFTGYLAKKVNIYGALIGAMLAGRIVSGLANLVILGFAGKPFALAGFLTGSFVTALPGIVVQIVFIPVIVLALRKAKLIKE